MIRKNYLILILFLLCHLFFLSRLQFTAWPEMVSFPYLINHGFVLYKDAIHAYPPLLVTVLAVLFKIFGYKLLVLKILGWATILFSDLLIFLILQKFGKKNNLAVYGVFIYALLQSILEGNMVWPDLFIIPFLLLTFLFLVHKKYFWGGVAIGLAVLTKQTGVLFLVVSIAYLVLTKEKLKDIFTFLIGGLVVGLPFFLLLLKQNSFSDFLNWTIIYPSKYWTKFPGYVQLSPTLRENLILLVLFSPFVILIFKVKQSLSLRDKEKIFSDKYFLLLFSFLLAGILGFYPRFSFFHLQSALAFLVVIIFYMIKKFSFWLLVVPILVLVLSIKSLQFGEARFWTNMDTNLGQIINAETPANKPVYVLGLNSNLYTYSDRLPNGPWLDNFGWYLEIPGVQEQVLKGFNENRPTFVFWQTPEVGNWYDIGVYQPKLITSYIIENYVKVKEIQKGVWEWKLKE